MHALIFWGFLVLFPTIVMAVIGAVDRDWSFPWLGAQGWYMAMVDVFVLAVLAGIVAAVWIRKVVRPRRFDGSHLGEADFILSHDRARRADAARLARVAHRRRAERVARALVVPLERGLASRRLRRGGARAHLRLGARGA